MIDHGVRVVPVPLPDPPLLASGSVKGQGYNPGYLDYVPRDMPRSHVLNLTATNMMHHPPHDAAQFVAEARQALAEKVASLPPTKPDDPPVPILLRMACALFSIKTVGSPMALAVVQHLAFSKHIQALADKVCQGMAAKLGKSGKASPVFNGVHLRIEEDAMSWLTNFDAGVSQERIWEMYYERCESAEVSRALPLYVASGILQDGAAKLPPQFTELQRRFASSIHHKEMYLTPADTASLDSEQLALIDFLVLATAQRFVGIATSTFSLFLVEYRAIQGVDRIMSGLVDLRSMPQFYYDYLDQAASFSI
ncbi:hypothetical protein WJX72_012059 [[Myrmecia] bisecta]|uniref:O-fucosyltransferase family protein n=1 Tax=[Myrmecia] bisecta TaxID=41462 RepID=A0AAW1Q2V7_9CHLO